MEDWICIANAGRNAITPAVRGRFDIKVRYKKLDIVEFDSSSFIALTDAPGLCPGDGWQLISHGTRGGKGPPGPRGERVDKGIPAPGSLVR